MRFRVSKTHLRGREEIKSHLRKAPKNKAAITFLGKVYFLRGVVVTFGQIALSEKIAHGSELPGARTRKIAIFKKI